MDVGVPEPSDSGGSPALVSRVATLLTLVSIFIFVLIGMALLLVHPRYQMSTLVSDDAGYYLAIARNYGLGYGYSFDRIHPTNGFNPLLPLILVPLNRLLSPELNLVTCFRIGTLITWAALLMGIAPLRSLTRRTLTTFEFPAAYRELAVASVTFLYVGFIAFKSYYGLDGFLVMGLALFLLGRVSKLGLLSPGIWNGLLDGALLGAIVLARVDSVPLAVAAFAMMMFRVVKGQGSASALVIRLIAFLVVVAPYFVANKVQFGDWLPISAKLKSSLPKLDPGASLDAVLQTSLNGTDKLVLFAGFALATGWSLWFVLRGRYSATSDDGFHARDAMAVLAIYLSLRLTWLLLFSRFDVQGGYFILAIPFIAIAALVLAGRIPGRHWALVGCVTIVVVTVGLMAGKIAKVVPSVQKIAAGADEWALGRHIHDAVTDDDVIYGGAFGLVGYVADRSWINGDGVANNRAYQDVIDAGRLEEYLACENVTHVVISRHPPSNLPQGPVSIAIQSPLHHSFDTLNLPGDAEPIVTGDLIRGGGLRAFLLPWSAPSSFDRASCDALPPVGPAE